MTSTAPRPSRRALLAGGAAAGATWAAPAVVGATTATASAASGCEPVSHVIQWDCVSYYRRDSCYARATLPVSNDAPLVLEIFSSLSGGMHYGNPWGQALDQGTANDNLRISRFAIGGTGKPGIVLHQNDYNCQRGGYQTVTFRFSRPVATLSAAISDIDTVVGDYRDGITISGVTATPSASLRKNDWGHYVSRDNVATNNWSGANNLSISGANLTQFQLRYFNDDRYYPQYCDQKDRDQRVFITDLAITLPPSGC